MNRELLTKLYTDAVDQCVKTGSGTDGTSLAWLWEEKFVERIVRECVKQMGISKQCDPYTGEVYVSVYNRAIDDQIAMLTEYFGVEE